MWMPTSKALRGLSKKTFKIAEGDRQQNAFVGRLMRSGEAIREQKAPVFQGDEIGAATRYSRRQVNDVRLANNLGGGPITERHRSVFGPAKKFVNQIKGLRENGKPFEYIAQPQSLPHQTSSWTAQKKSAGGY